MSISLPPELDEGSQAASISIQQSEQIFTTRLFVKTKLFVPPTGSNLIARPRLIAQMNAGLDRALILVSAPAGYGKTTLVSSWLRQADLPSAWLTLDEGDNDPICFLQYFMTALQKIVPAVQMDWLGVLQERQPAPYESLLNILINAIAEQAVPFVLVLDDFHTLHAAPLLKMIAYLLDHLPPQLHLVLLTRTDPPLPLSRLRVRDRLVEIRAAQLRFTPGEIASFLEQMVSVKLSPADLQALEIRTEGWIAGLQLASIAMQSHLSVQRVADIHSFVSAFTGSHYYIMDYLVEEVLTLQTEPLRSFLLKTSILRRMCGPLCDAVVAGEASAEPGGREVLVALEQMNLFLVPLDGERHWYRYHHLFADVLSRRLEQLFPQELPGLHRRAARWFEQHGFIDDAIYHLVHAGEIHLAAQLVDGHGCLLLMRGEVVNLLSWIAAVEPYSQTVPWIAIQKAWALCLNAQLDQAEGPLQIADQLIASLEPDDGKGTMLGAVTAVRAFRANMQGQARLAGDLARQALDFLPLEDDFSCSLRSVATSILGDASWTAGDLLAAGQAYTEALRISQAVGDAPMALITSSNLADVLIEQGRLQQAADLYSEALHLAALPDGQGSPLNERIYAGLSRIAYEWNHLDAARESVQKCLQLSEHWGSFEFKVVGDLILARLELASSNPEAAQRAVLAAQETLREVRIYPWRSSWVKSTLVRLYIAQGVLDRASDLFQESGIAIENTSSGSDILSYQEPMAIALLRLRLAYGDIDAALALSDQLLHKLEASSRVGQFIEVLVLQSLAFQGRRDLDRALSALEKAFSFARPGGYVRLFLDEGEPMAKLLYQARVRSPQAGYASELLSVLAKSPTPALPLDQLLIEPLTTREIEVLKLIEAGYSNSEIAARLVLSIATVKRHISNIYAKLGVTSRTQALSRGRELKLF